VSERRTRKASNRTWQPCSSYDAVSVSEAPRYPYPYHETNSVERGVDPSPCGQCARPALIHHDDRSSICGSPGRAAGGGVDGKPSLSGLGDCSFEPLGQPRGWVVHSQPPQQSNWVSTTGASRLAVGRIRERGRDLRRLKCRKSSAYRLRPIEVFLIHRRKGTPRSGSSPTSPPEGSRLCRRCTGARRTIPQGFSACTRSMTISSPAEPIGKEAGGKLGL